MTKANLRNITLSADPVLIDRARAKALGSSKSLNEIFREWLAEFTHSTGSSEEFDAVMKKLSYAVPGRKFTREEMNER